MGNLYRSCKNESHQHAPPEPAFNIPKGFKKIGNAYSNGNQIVIEGEPPSDAQDPDAELHNCDTLGCGQNHVLYRFVLE